MISVIYILIFVMITIQAREKYNNNNVLGGGTLSADLNAHLFSLELPFESSIIYCGDEKVYK